jgi:hypothetical protein
MTTAAWTIMTVSVTTVIALLAFCMYRVLTLPPVEVEESMHGPVNIDTGDTLDAD